MSAAPHPRYVQLCMENVCMSFEVVFCAGTAEQFSLVPPSQGQFCKERY